MSYHKFTRRTMLGGTLGGFLAYATRNGWERAMAREHFPKAKRCVVLWMNGGPSQFETFDPKPGTSTGGEFKSISTAVPGIEICETLPHIAKQMAELSVVRSVASSEGEHVRAQYYLHAGYPFVPGFPRPSMGSVISHESQPADFPRYVTIGSPGYGPAYMGLQHAPFSIEEPEEALELMRSIRRRKRRINLLQDLGATFDAEHPSDKLDRRRSMVARIETLVATPFVDALDLGRESERVRNRYGDQPFGQACLLARRLLEIGVNFVEVQHDGWDTHANNFRSTKELCGQIDKPWAALMEDLNSSGLLEEMVVLWMGEFGRTPAINASNGRDHFPNVTPAVVGGGGIAGGRVIGGTTRTGTAIEGEPHKVADLFATIFSTLGIDPAKEFTTSFNSPAPATDGGSTIRELTS